MSESNTQRLRILKQNEASAIAAAASQIELALHEAHEPVEDLGLLIGQISSTLGEMRSSGNGAHTRDTDAAIARLEKALHGSIERLQFYDSMVQHLSHVRDYLANVATHLAHGAETHPAPIDVRGPADAAAWEKLRHQLRGRLITDSQRELLDLVLPTGGAAGQQPRSPARERDTRAPADNTELF